MPQEPTPQQRAIWHEITEGRTHLIIEARAGTGKTTTLEQAARLLPTGTRALFCAFNKHIADELKKRLPSSCTATTIHGFGRKQIMNASTIENVQLDEDKVQKILRKMAVPNTEQKTHSAIKRLVTLCKARLFRGDDADQLRWLVGRYGVDLPSDPSHVFSVIEDVLRHCAETPGVIDFDDMIWLPATFNIPVEAFDFVFVDESQDLNFCQQRIVMKACPSGRMVVVGDRYQSIYGFRGADSESMQTMESMLAAHERSVQSLSLTATFRCPRAHVAIAKMLVPDIEAAPKADRGQVTYVADTKKAASMMRAGDMVICRTNAPLIEIAELLVRRGERVMLSGKDFKDDLVNTVLRLHPESLEDFVALIEQYRKEREQKMLAKGVGGASLIKMHDVCDCLLALRARSSTVDELQKKIQSLFRTVDEKTDTSKTVLLSSIHRVKGLEKDSVFIIRSDLLPHPKATEPWQKQQEKNLAYVAVTRAKKHLYFVGEVSELFPRAA